MLTRKERKAIEDALYHLNRAARFVEDDRTLIGRAKPQATTTEDYSRADGSAFTPITKDIGSDLCGLEFARSGLRNMLAMDEAARPARKERNANR
ncbi:MAG: hypothetical protein ACF8XB_09115 [Planctomycetota bacterium JB042]